MPTQGHLPADYLRLGAEALNRRIAARKAELGAALCILGHHYQRDEVLRFADHVGDSLKLSRQAAAQRDAAYVVFCGVHFMAESADVLTADRQAVCLPSLAAGCAMAEMADAAAVAAALEELGDLTAAKIVPVTYVNSAAAVKAVTARAGGACCTSSNVRNVLAWALGPTARGGAGGEKVFCIPDEHLGRNTAVAMGYAPDDCAVYDPALPAGGLSADDVRRATFLLWKGHCYVHQVFRAEDVERVRRRHEGIRVIVHPECPREVVRRADASGSTEQIIRAVAAGPPGSAWAVGTESHLVDRLARRHDDRLVRSLSDRPVLCAQMGQIDLPHLLWTLDALAAGRAVNRIRVAPDVAADARAALQRMIDIRGVAEAAPTAGARRTP
jgi:quinolinate synthase